MAGALAVAGCVDHAPLSENTNVQDTKLTQSKYAELAPAEAVFTGDMQLLTGKSFPCVLQVKRTFVEKPADQPTETVEVPVLTAVLAFPVLQGADNNTIEALWARYPELMNPMGSMPQVVVDYGNYNASDHSLTLPYSVPAYTQGNFGLLSGTLLGDHFKGSWFAKPEGDVATFDLVKEQAN
jgi:hypothetical protein